MKVHLSDGEWKLMNKLWDASPRTITELTAALRGDTGWSKNTVITMLSRLEGKDAVYYEEGLRAKQYYPAVTREEALAMGETFQKMIRGEASPVEIEGLEEASALQDISHMPARVKCAMLGWRTMTQALTERAGAKTE